MDSQHDITLLLNRYKDGDPEALASVFETAYGELKAIANNLIHHPNGSATLGATGLVNEVWLSLFGQKKVDWCDRQHFFSTAALLMRRILVDNARRRHAEKRGGNQVLLWFDDSLFEATMPDAESLLALDQSLEQLKQIDSIASDIMIMRYFAGMTLDEISSVLGISAKSARQKVHFALAWLKCNLDQVKGEA